MTLTALSPDLAPWRERFDLAHPAGGAPEPTLFQSMRTNAMAALERSGFPTPRHEEWKYTNPASLLAVRYDGTPSPQALSDQDATSFAVPNLLTTRLVLVDGVLRKDLTRTLPLPPNTFIGTLSEAVGALGPAFIEQLHARAGEQNHPFALLNTALFEDGVVVSVPRNQQVQHPIEILHLTTGTGRVAVFPKVYLHLDIGASATVLEIFSGREGATTLTSAVTDGVVESNAHLRHVVIQRQPGSAYHLHLAQFQVGAHSTVTNHAYNFGARLSRNDLRSRLTGSGITMTMNGVYLVNGQQHHDTHTVMDHTQPHCDSHEFYKGILDGAGRGVFNGKIFVRQAAQKTDAKQSNKNLLLSDDARIETKPQLEIWADDVKCTHGCTVGHLDETALFYLRSRGIPLAQARHMLTQAFAMEITESLDLPEVRSHVDELIIAKLETGQVSGTHS